MTEPPVHPEGTCGCGGTKQSHHQVVCQACADSMPQELKDRIDGSTATDYLTSLNIFNEIRRHAKSRNPQSNP